MVVEEIVGELESSSNTKFRSTIVLQQVYLNEEIGVAGDLRFFSWQKSSALGECAPFLNNWGNTGNRQTLKISFSMRLIVL